MLKAIIFDFDYTLGDSTNGIAICINYALGKLGYSARNLSDIRRTVGLSLKDTYAALTFDENLDKAEKFAKLFIEKADEVMVDNTELYTGVKDVLHKLKVKGYQTGIVTTKFRYRIEKILNKFDAEELIDIIVGADDVKVEKPNPEGLLWTVAHLNLRKENVLYVGDSLVDAKTAENAKVDFAGVLTGTTTKEEFEKHPSVYIGKDITEIYDFILKLEQSHGTFKKIK
ncbi:MAG: HAD family hydrolase [Lachnospiraceae bacterium]|nr:HAD family hydrolase [Lachnospiraceae bacterium]